MTEFKKVGSLTDFNAVESLAHKIWNEHYAPIIGQAQVAYMLDKYQSFKAIRHQVREGAKYYIVKHDQKDIGYVSFEIKDEDAFMSKIYLLSSHRGKGIGKDCLRFVENYAKENGLRALSLSVNKKNLLAKSFYENNNFKIIEEVAVDIGGGFVMDDYYMRKAI